MLICLHIYMRYANCMNEPTATCLRSSKQYRKKITIISKAIEAISLTVTLHLSGSHLSIEYPVSSCLLWFFRHDFMFFSEWKSFLLCEWRIVLWCATASVVQDHWQTHNTKLNKNTTVNVNQHTYTHISLALSCRCEIQLWNCLFTEDTDKTTQKFRLASHDARIGDKRCIKCPAGTWQAATVRLH